MRQDGRSASLYFQVLTIAFRDGCPWLQRYIFSDTCELGLKTPPITSPWMASLNPTKVHAAALRMKASNTFPTLCTASNHALSVQGAHVYCWNNTLKTNQRIGFVKCSLPRIPKEDGHD